MPERSFVDLLYADAPRPAYDDLLDQLGPAAADEHARALQLRERMSDHRTRETELSALYDTANDLSRLRDLDTVLSAIVRRARQLLGADMTYLSLNDEADGASYMKVTDGALTPEFRQLRLPLGTGLLGLVAQTGEPSFTDDYQSDERFVHRDYIDSAVDGEHIRAILGVPLVVDGEVIGALLAVHRTVRPFPAREVTLLTSFAAHAAVALENARLFDEARGAVARGAASNRLLQARSEAVELAAQAHDRLTDVLVRGGGVEEIADVLSELLRGDVTIYDGLGRVLAGQETGPQPDPATLSLAVDRARRFGHSVETAPGVYLSAAAAGHDHLGTLVVRAGPLAQAERRTVERAAIVTALVLLFARTQAEAEDRVRGELLADIVSERSLDEALLRGRALRQGADLDRPSCVAVALLPETDGAELHAAGRTAARLAQERHGLSTVREGTVVLLAAGSDAGPASGPDTGSDTGHDDRPLDLGRELHRRLGGEATVGVAAAPPGRTGVLAAFREARQCAVTLTALGRAGTVSASRGLGLTRLILGSSGPAELADFVADTLGPLLSYDAERSAHLVDTLDAWFATGGSLRGAGERLHVHANTVAQRLERVSGLIGDDWRDPARGLELQLALRVHAVR